MFSHNHSGITILWQREIPHRVLAPYPRSRDDFFREDPHERLRVTFLPHPHYS